VSALALLARNAAVLAVAEGTARLASAAFVVVAARRLGAEGYGLYATSLTFLLFARMLSRFGIQSVVVVRDVAERKDLTSRYLTSTILLALPPSLAIWLALPWMARALGYGDQLPWLLAVLGASLVGHAVARPAEEVLRAHERMLLFGSASLGLSLATAASGVALLLLGFRLGALMALQAGAAWVEAALLLGLAHRYATRLSWQPSRDVMRRLAREGLPLFLLVALDLTLTRIDVLVLARLAGPDAVGLYVPAVRILEYVVIFRTGVGGALFPFLAARWQGSPGDLSRAYQEARRLYVVYAVGCAVVLTAGADSIVGLLFGAAYLPGALVLKILVWAMVADLAAGPVAEVILVRRAPLGPLVPATGALALTNLLLNLWLVPRFSYAGAAVAALATAVIGLGLRTWWVQRLLHEAPPSLWAALWRPAVGALAMAGVFGLTRPTGFWVAIGPAVLCYAVTLVATGAVRVEEIARVSRALSSILLRRHRLSED
jgi:O-antigen/teichoic acid export membrane protein